MWKSEYLFIIGGNKKWYSYCENQCSVSSERWDYLSQDQDITFLDTFLKGLYSSYKNTLFLCSMLIYS